MKSIDLINSIINDLNEYIRANANGQYVQGCVYVSNIAQKLILLRERASEIDKKEVKHGK